MDPNASVYVAGGTTLLGRALVDCLRATGYRNVIGGPDVEPNLAREREVQAFFRKTRPAYVIVAGGKSGGIRANLRRPAILMRHNLLAMAHILQAAHRHGVRKLLYLASSCCYPRNAPQPLQTDSLFNGPLEPTNEAYATAKLAGLVMCRAYRQQYGAPFITAIPSNAFGPHDDFHTPNAHVIPSLIGRMHRAKEQGADTVIVWGTGKPRREVAYSRTLARACLFVLDHYDDPAPINLGCGTDLSIAEIAEAVANTVGFRGQIRFDPTKPDGMPFKALDSSALRALGWRYEMNFRNELAETYQWFLKHACHKDVDSA